MPSAKPPRRRAKPGLGEFGRIARYFAPLTRSFPGADLLRDDCAVIRPPRGHALVAKTDTITATVHTIGNEPPDLVARKALRANLSDLAGKGAYPHLYLLSLSTPRGTPDAWIKRFARGLARDQREFGVVLAGGDSVSAPGPVSVTITVLGTGPSAGIPRRGDAKAGDDIYVSGTIGDAALGLLVLRGKLGGLSRSARAYLVNRYRLPRPRLDAGTALRGAVNAAMDISDGLVGDLGHICKWSRLGAVIEWRRVPLSPAARRAEKTDPRLSARILGGGDDYELLFTASRAASDKIAAAAKRVGVPLTRIGRMTKGRGVRVLDARGRDITPRHRGYEHR